VITNRAAQSVKVSVADMYKGKTTELHFGAGATVSDPRSLSRESGWYDFVITTNAEASIAYQVAGHVENGKDSISDPAIGSI
jgi:phospholipase C